MFTFVLVLYAACCQLSVYGTPVSALKDMSSDWRRVVSVGHLTEAFSTMGQFHILDPAVSSSEKSYHVNLHSYNAMRGKDLEELSMEMEYSGYEGYIKWFLDANSGTWKLVINSCEQDFDVDPTASAGDEYHWILLLTDQTFFLKCNNVVVATVVNSANCYPKIGKGKLAIGGWELINAVGMKTRFENMKNIGSCAMPSYYYNQRGLLGIKKLTTAEDCHYDCQHTTNCKKATIDMMENSCKLYSSFGGQARYKNQQNTDSESRYLNYLFGTQISLDLDCFAHKDDPCWRNDVRFEMGAQETTVKSVEYCLEDHYKNGETAMWNPVTGRCSAIHDTYVKIAEIPSPGFKVVYNMCKTLRDGGSDYEDCLEYGVILDGKVLSEITDKFPYDCKEACENSADCSGWSSLTEIRKCYLYTGPVYGKSYPRAVSGTYNCLTELAPVPQDPNPSRLVEPVSTNFNLLSVSSPGVLNLLIGDDDNMRTVYVYEDGVEQFKFDMFPRKQNAAFDFRLEGCAAAFNYTKQPCAYKRRSQNFYQINLLLSAGELSIDMSCGETAGEMSTVDYVFFTQDKLVESCGLTLSLTKWNGIVFENFNSDDKYNIGITAEYPKRTVEDPTPTPHFTTPATTAPP